jgi:hypothetical protein
MTSKIAQAGDVNFTAIRLMNGAGVDIDISNLVVNIDLFESIHRPFISGSILIADSKALMSRFPIIGEELLHLRFETPTTGKFITKTFFIDRLETRYGENNKSAYILHFTSVNMLKDMNLKHSSAYSGYASDIVPELFKKTLVDSWPSTEDEIYVEKTANKIKFISNFWSPFRCISYCANSSISANDAMQSPSFIFYEDNKKYNFRSVGELVTTGNATSSSRQFFFDAVNGRKDAASGTSYALIAQYETILNLKVVGGFDYFRRHAAGAWANRVVEFDLLRKSINTRLYNYWYDFENSGHLGEHPAVSNQVQYDDTNANVEEKTIFTHAHEGVMNDQRGVITAKRNGLLANLDYMSLELEIHGRTDLVVGDVIDLRLQNFASSFGVNDTDSGLDQLWSGNYIITEIQHRLSTNRHKIVMRVSKDGVNKKITFPEKIQ